MFQKPIVYIGIVTYNSMRDLPPCLASIRKQKYRNIKIIIYDNASSDTVVSWLRKHAPNILLISNTDNIGFGRAHNRIIQSIQFQDNDYYLPLNPDVVLDVSYVTNLMSALQKHRAQWGVGKLYLDQKKTMLYSVGHALRRDGFAFNIGQGEIDTGQYNTEREIFGAPAAASLMSIRMIRTISDQWGLFDSSLFMYYEDVELDWRSRLTGLRCWYAPSAFAVHTGAKLSRRLELESIVNRYLSVFKNAFFTDLVFYNIPIIVFHCIVRLIITPLEGLQLLYRLFCQCPIMFKKRRKPHISQYEMHRWFTWSEGQQTKQPTTYISRAQFFIRKQMSLLSV